MIKNLNLVDSDILVGRREILAFLRLCDWTAVSARIKEGLPVVKVCGRLEMRIVAYDEWKNTFYKAAIRKGRKGKCQ